ncbi:hypothetical protein [Bacteroides sp.]
MKIERELTPREIGFFGKLQDLFVEYNAIVHCNENKEIYVVIDGNESAMWNHDITFRDALDETDIDELFEESCKLHNEKVK